MTPKHQKAQRVICSMVTCTNITAFSYKKGQRYQHAYCNKCLTVIEKMSHK